MEKSSIKGAAKAEKRSLRLNQMHYKFKKYIH
jgi:hypothetical protein